MRRLALLSLALLAAAPAHANQGESEPAILRPASSSPSVEMTGGLEYQEGKHGTGQKIETLSTPVTARFSTGRIQLSATLPYVRVDAPGNVVAGGAGLLGVPIIVDPSQPATRDRREGLGDLKLGAAWSVPNSLFDLTLLGQVKLPTASAHKRLGTGETDYMVGAEVARRFGSLTPFAGLSYTLPGDPSGYELRNSLSARAGLAAALSQRVRGYVSYSYAQSLSRLVANQQQVTTGINAGLSNRLTLGLYGSAGLSEGAPDAGAGIQLGIKLF